MVQNVKMVISVGPLGAWLSERGSGRGGLLGKAGSRGQSLVCKHAHLTLLRSDKLSSPWKTPGDSERLAGGLLSSPGCLPCAGVVGLHTSHTSPLWPALAPKPPGGLSCHPHCAMIPTSLWVHGV